MREIFMQDFLLDIEPGYQGTLEFGLLGKGIEIGFLPK
jgi:hypothetical protein